MRQFFAGALLASVSWAVGADISQPGIFKEDGVVSGAWKFDGAAITGTATGGGSAWLVGADEYEDYKLGFKFRTPKPCRAGVVVQGHRIAGFNSATRPDAAFGYTISLDTAEPKRVGTVTDNFHGTVLVSPIQVVDQALLATDWNSVSITVSNAIIEVELNGTTISRVADEAYISGRIAFVVSPATGDSATLEIEPIMLLGFSDGKPAWRSLFDGKTLDAWKNWGTESWEVVDGVIQGRRGPKKSEGYLATEERFKDFRVRGQFKMLGEGNYGLFYHSTIKLRENDGYPMIAGVQGEVMPGVPAETGRLYESYKRGWLMPKDHEDIGSWALREGEWNEIEIRNIGNHVTTWVNGIRVVDFVDPSPQLFEGSFALQLHTGEGAGIDWKGLYVQEPIAP